MVEQIYFCKECLQEPTELHPNKDFTMELCPECGLSDELVDTEFLTMSYLLEKFGSNSKDWPRQIVKLSVWMHINQVVLYWEKYTEESQIYSVAKLEYLLEG